ncbi:putative F-box protein [Cardamine amara subsp. amara]|uniref:F-box protein n=1 Tax=Cardamine amara subsp. amara TaxID=228776 RepID=A0ABD1BYJ4_CARAN
MESRNIPWDLIVEILSRVPAKSLARLRSTSKPWNTLLKSRRFAKMHSANAPKEFLIIMLMDDKVKMHACRSDTSIIHNNNVAPSVKLASQFYLEKMHFISSRLQI